MDQFWAAPPVARTLTALTFVQSALVLGGLVDYHYILFIPQLLFKMWPEVWRLLTPFLMTGGGLAFIFDLYFMYTYSSKLEVGSPRFTVPGSFFIYVVFVGFVIMLTAGFYLGAMIFTHAFIMALVYTYAQDNKGTRTTFFVIQIPTLLLPWAMLTLTFVIGGWHAALVDFTGIVAAHLYDFLTRIYPTFGGGKNYIVTPGFVRRYFTQHLREGEYRTYGRAYRPTSDGQEPSRSWTSSIRNPWDSRGAGRRLGGD